MALQIRAIRDELGENDEDEDDVVALEKKMHDARMPPNVWKHAQRELRYVLENPGLFLYPNLNLLRGW